MIHYQICYNCGHDMIEIHCKSECPRCGSKIDCGD